MIKYFGVNNKVRLWLNIFEYEIDNDKIFWDKSKICKIYWNKITK